VTSRARTALFLPIFDELSDPGLVADLAVEAELAGWDGLFVWDHMLYRPPVTTSSDLGARGSPWPGPPSGCESGPW